MNTRIKMSQKPDPLHGDGARRPSTGTTIATTTNRSPIARRRRSTPEGISHCGRCASGRSTGRGRPIRSASSVDVLPRQGCPRRSGSTGQRWNPRTTCRRLRLHDRKCLKVIDTVRQHQQLERAHFQLRPNIFALIRSSLRANEAGNHFFDLW